MPYKSIVRATVKLMLPGLVSEFGTATKIIQALTGQGLTYRRQVMLDDIRLIQGRQNLGEARAAWDTSQAFPDELVPELFMKEGQRYRTYGEVTYWDPQHEALIVKKHTHYSDYNASEEFYRDEIRSIMEAQEQYTEDERYYVVAFEMKGVEHNRRMAKQIGSY